MEREIKTMTIKECAELYNIGVNRLREICKADDCPFVIRIGARKRIIKAKAFDEWFNTCEAI